MTTLQKSIVATVVAIEIYRLCFELFAPYKILVNRISCGPWIASLLSKPADHPCRLAASGRIRSAFVEAVLVLLVGYGLALLIGARGSGGPGRGGGPPPDDRPKKPSPSPMSSAR